MNTTLCEKVFPYAKWALIMSIIGRAVLLLISLKRLSICKVHFYYEMLVLAVLFCLPQDIDQEVRVTLFLADTLVNFMMHYFHLWSSLITMLVV